MRTRVVQITPTTGVIRKGTVASALEWKATSVLKQDRMTRKKPAQAGATGTTSVNGRHKAHS